MKKLSFIFCISFVILSLHGCSSMARVKHSIQGVSKVSVSELKTMLGSPEITILDVRDVPDWNKSKTKIPNAIRESPDDINSWADKYDKDQKIILYCA